MQTVPGFNFAAIILVLLITSTVRAAPQWIEHASSPGPDYPANGVSRFDQMFLQSDGIYRIPYPFTKLIETLEARVINGSSRSVRQVLVPIGRSLQRDTPAPNYFHYPRSVIAIEGEPVTTTNPTVTVVPGTASPERSVVSL